MAFCDYTRLIYVSTSILILFLLRWAFSTIRNRRRHRSAETGSCGGSAPTRVLPPMPSSQRKKGVVWTVTNYNTSWCGHSRHLQPTWDKLMVQYKNSPRVQLIDMKCDNYDCSKVPIEGYPSILAEDEAGKIMEYRGDRSFDDIRSFIDGLVTPPS